MRHAEPWEHLDGIIDGGIEVRQNPLLRDLTLFSRVTSVGAASPGPGSELTIWDNHSLTDLSGLDNIEYAYRVDIFGNKGLASLNGLGSLKETQSFKIESSPALTTLEGLNNELTVHQGFVVRDSPRLRRCEIEAFIDSLDPPPGSVEITNVSEEPCN